ncbi:hypothetical protein D3C87_1624200 [compost metagenome]
MDFLFVYTPSSKLDLSLDSLSLSILHLTLTKDKRLPVFATILVAVVAAIHLYILVLEMFLWNTKTGRKAFNLSADFARETRVLAANQGLYNGSLAAGLLWGLWLGERGISVIFFFLICVLIAGVFGAVTASRKILYVQALPALAAMLALLIR